MLAGRRTHTHPRGVELSSYGCCKTNDRECEHGLCLALVAVQVCLMSHCCDYQHGALAQLEAPQVNHRGEAAICSAGGPRTTWMGFHLLPGHWTFWKAFAHDALGLLEGARHWCRTQIRHIRNTSALPFLACHPSCLPFWATTPCMFTSGLLGFMCACVFARTKACMSVLICFSRLTQWVQMPSSDACGLRQLCSVPLQTHFTVLG